MTSVKSTIKYINGGDPSKRFDKSKPKPEAPCGSARAQEAPRPARAPEPQARSARAPNATLVAQSDTERLHQALEEGRRVYNEVVVMHKAARSDLDSANNRLARVEQDLRKEREFNALYVSQVASQERELRRLKEAKRAAEDLNSKLNARLSEGAGLAGRDGRNWKSEADTLRHKLGAYAELMAHADQVLGVCAQLCAPHSKETAQEILEAQRTMREFQASVPA